jgi:ENTH domain
VTKQNASKFSASRIYRARAMFAASILARGKAAIAGSETEQRISVLLYDDTVQEISSFELNQLASLTYHEEQVITSATDLAGLLVDHLETILSQPAQFSTLSMQKSLAVTEHLLLFGAEKVLRMIHQQLGRSVEGLRTYNTVLLAQQQYGAWWMQIKGGGVDLGGPVREKAQVIVQYLLQPPLLHQERQRRADPNSLVPIGSPQQVAFCTDEMRFQKLKEQMERQHAMQIRSNLAKASNGYGSGYNAANGQMVVGAAHSLEEMIAQQKKQEQKFRDDRAAAQASVTSQSFAEYQAPNLLDTTPAPISTMTSSSSSTLMMNTTPGIGSLSAAPPPAAEVDLLDFSWTPSPPPSAVPAYNAPVPNDLLAFAMPHGAVVQQTPVDPFAPSATTTPPAPAPDQDLLGFSVQTTTILPSATQAKSTFLSDSALLSTVDPFASLASPAQQAQPRPMSSLASPPSHDKFGALDSLAMAPNTALSMGGSSGAVNSSMSVLNPLSSSSSIPPAISLSSIRIGQTVPNFTGDDDEMNVMGGTMGAGLAPAPMASPPPPPPSTDWY